MKCRFAEVVPLWLAVTTDEVMRPWPYPIDPWLGELLPDEYDLLICSKNGHRPGLLEHLCELFPRHVMIHYGRYRRENLYEAARRSRACAYLADDHGPLALQEILLAGCPVAGVRTGVAFVKDGETGVLVDRLPPGAKCASNDADGMALNTFTQAIRVAQSMDREALRGSATIKFSRENLLAILLEHLNMLRQ